MREFTVKHSKDFRLKVRITPCSFPKDLYTIEYIQQQLDEFNHIKTESSYQFFLTDEQMQILSKGLLNDNHQD